MEATTLEKYRRLRNDVCHEHKSVSWQQVLGYALADHRTFCCLMAQELGSPLAHWFIEDAFNCVPDNLWNEMRVYHEEWWWFFEGINRDLALMAFGVLCP
jgi:hypothetical protein